VPRLPTAVLATGCVLIAVFSFTTGLILEAVAHGRMEIKRLGYLAIPPYGGAHADPDRSVPGDVPSFGMATERFGEPGLLSVPRGTE
jgi:hypothetical protein